MAEKLKDMFFKPPPVQAVADVLASWGTSNDLWPHGQSESAVAGQSWFSFVSSIGRVDWGDRHLLLAPQGFAVEMLI